MSLELRRHNIIAIAMGSPYSYSSVHLAVGMVCGLQGAPVSTPGKYREIGEARTGEDQ